MPASIHRILLFALSLAGVLVFALPAEAGNWPGWRGPHGNGISDESTAPLEWSAGNGVRWTAAIPGMGVSTPIVWDDRVFVTSSSGRQQRDLHLLCLARRDGTVLWHRRFFGSAPTRYFQGRSSMATPTPVTDGRHVWAFFGTGDLFCLDVDGELVWTRSLVQEYERFQNRFGMASSPLLVGRMLVLQCDHWGQSYLLAMDKASGTNVWKADREENLSWTTPLITNVAGRTEIVVPGTLRVRSYDLDTGKQLWMVEGLTRDMVPTPVAGDGMIFVTCGPGGASYAIRAGGSGNITGSHVAWRNPRGAPFVPSPLYLDGRYYLINDTGIVTCLDGKSGKPLKQQRIGEKFTASPVAAAGRLYFVDETGATTVLSADENVEILARNELDENVLSSPAVSHGELFIRGMSHLYCIDGAK
jgi:outer membrane protein assembly factor BamB